MGKLTKGKRDETKLPIWAQRLISDLRFEIESLQALKNAHAVLSDGRDWFTLQGPHDAKEAPRSLWLLDKNRPFPVCSLSHGDVLLVGRSALKEASDV